MVKEKFNLKGVKPSPHDERDLNFHLGRFVTFEEELPAEFDSETHEVRNQGSHGSCVAFGGCEAYAISKNKNKIKPNIPTEKETWFRSYVCDSLTRLKVIRKPYMLIDGWFEYYADFSGVIACKIPNEIIEKGEVEVNIWCEGYKTKVFNIDFELSEDVSRACYLTKGKSDKPIPIDTNDEDPILPNPPEPVEPEPEVIPDNVPDEILPKKKTFAEILIQFFSDFLKNFFNQFKVKSFGYENKEVVMYSPKWLYSKCKELDGKIIDNGTFPVRACEVLSKFGVVEERDCPYVNPVPEDLSADEYLHALAKENKIKSYHKLRSIEEVKRALFNGFGVTVAVNSANLLQGWKKENFPSWSKQPWAGHQMSFTRWDTQGVWVKNSWGKAWGKDGYCRIPNTSEWWSNGIFEMWAIMS